MVMNDYPHKNINTCLQHTIFQKLLTQDNYLLLSEIAVQNGIPLVAPSLGQCSSWHNFQ